MNKGLQSRIHIQKRLRHWASVSLCVVLLMGCTMVGPDFQKPEMALPAAYSESTAGRQTPAIAQEIDRWWTSFHDQLLSSLVERAAVSNLDIKLADARIRQARAVRAAANAGASPTLDMKARYSRNESQPEGFSSQYQGGFDAGWEVDFFGRVRRNVEAAEADLEAASEARRNALVILSAEVVRNYIELRALQQRIVIARQNLEAQKRSAELTRQRFSAGLVSRLDVVNAEAQLASLASQLPLFEASARQTMHAIAILIGLEPGALVEELSQPEGITAVTTLAVPTGIPSDLLRRRPDIRRAEALIHAATARIGVATADLFPKITLSGFLNLQGDTVNSLFDWTNRLLSFGPQASWPLFDSNRVGASIEQQKALEEQAFITYQQTVLTALQEVEDALAASKHEEERRKSLQQAVQANRKAVELAITLYIAGQTDYLNVLQAQRSLYSSEDSLSQSELAMATNLVSLYKALGGGWEISGE